MTAPTQASGSYFTAGKRSALVRMVAAARPLVPPFPPARIVPMSHLRYPKYSASAELNLDRKGPPTLMFVSTLVDPATSEAFSVHRWNLTHYADLIDEALPDWKEWAERVRADPSAPIPDHVEQVVRDVFGLPPEDSTPQCYPVGHFFRPDETTRPKIDPDTVPVVVRFFLANFSTAHDLIAQPVA
jgi:hypothetical protein